MLSSYTIQLPKTRFTCADIADMYAQNMLLLAFILYLSRRTSQLSISALQELAKGQDGELALGKEIVNPGKYNDNR